MVIFHSEKVYQQVFGKSRGNQRKPGDPNMIKIPILFVSVLKSALHVKKTTHTFYSDFFGRCLGKHQDDDLGGGGSDLCGASPLWRPGTPCTSLLKGGENSQRETPWFRRG